MPTNPTRVPRYANKEIGASGTIIYQGIISGEDYNTNLTGIRANKQYEIMRRSDSTIRSALQVVKLPLLSTVYTIAAPRDADGKITEEYQDRADFIERELQKRKVDFFHFLKSATTHFEFGFSVFEKVLGLTDYKGQPRIGLEKLAFRKQVSIHAWEQADGTPGVTQQLSNGQKFSIPRDKLVIFTFDKEGDNDEGISLLRHIYKDWDMKDKLTLVNAMSLEKQGMGVPVVQARENSDPAPEDEEKAVEVLSNLRANESGFLKVPKTMTVEMLDMKGQTTKEIIPTLNYHDGRIMAGVLARFMELGGASGSGSQSLSQDLSSIFMKSEEAAAKELVAVINEQIIKPLCDLNFADNSDGYPTLEYGSISDDDLTELSTSLSNLMNAGAITSDVDLEDHLRSRMRLPELTEERRKEYESKEPAKDPGTKDGPIDKKKQKEVEVEASLKAAADYRIELMKQLQG